MKGRVQNREKLRKNTEQQVFLFFLWFSLFLLWFFVVFQCIFAREGFPQIPWKYALNPPKIIPLSMFSVLAPERRHGKVGGWHGWHDVIAVAKSVALSLKLALTVAIRDSFGYAKRIEITLYVPTVCCANLVWLQQWHDAVCCANRRTATHGAAEQGAIRFSVQCSSFERLFVRHCTLKLNMHFTKTHM